MKRITVKGIENCDDGQELYNALMFLVERLSFSLNTAINCESIYDVPHFVSKQVRAELCIERLKELDFQTPEGTCDIQELNLGDFLC